jgi:hypothetical protein
LPVPNSNVQIRWDDAGSKKLEYSTDGGATWTTILTAGTVNAVTAVTADGANRQLKQATTPCYVFSAGSQGSPTTIDTGVTC